MRSVDHARLTRPVEFRITICALLLTRLDNADMLLRSSHTLSKAAAFCLCLTTAAQADTALVINADSIPSSALSKLQSTAEREGFWIGVEHQDAATAKLNWRDPTFDAHSMIFAVVSDQSAQLLRADPAVLGAFDQIKPSDFALQSVACDAADEKLHLPAIMKIGRGNLVRKPRSFFPLADPVGLTAIPKNQWLTKRYAAPSKIVKRVVDPQVQTIVNQIDGARWFAAITQLATWRRNSYSVELDLARDWLVTQFAAVGQSTQIPSFTVAGAVTAENVVATQTGTTLPNEWVLVGAHYDSRNISATNTTNPSPGAEDNASGCAGVLEMARVLSQYRFKRTLKFICFAGEEQGLLGSEAFASSAPAANIKLAVLMDMIGYSSDTRFDVLLETSAALSSVFAPFQTAATDYSPGLAVLTSTNPFGSDHIPFINRSVPSLLLIEDEWDTYAQYHRATDTPANITNAQQQGPAILKMAVAVLAQTAEFDTGNDFASGFE
jgi:hypothetical protein